MFPAHSLTRDTTRILSHTTKTLKCQSLSYTRFLSSL